LKSLHKSADPNCPLFDEWVDSPNSFSVVTHSIREMNDQVYSKVRQQLPSSLGPQDDDEDDEEDEEPLIFSRPEKEVSKEEKPKELPKVP